MALYSYFFYSLGSELQLKAYSVIEYALRIKTNRQDLMLRQLLTLANQKNWLQDSMFRHIKEPDEDNSYCHSLEKILPQQRNESAHGIPPLVWDYIGHIERCADLVNQLFSRLPKSKWSLLGFQFRRVAGHCLVENNGRLDIFYLIHICQLIF